MRVLWIALAVSFSLVLGSNILSHQNLSATAGSDSSGLHNNQAGEINAITEKTTTSGNDVIVIEDTTASFGKKRVKISTLIGGTWKTWTPTFTGFSVAPVVNAARYIQIGHLVIAILNTGQGTSNSSAFTVTLPLAAYDEVTQTFTVGYSKDNGVTNTTPGRLRTRTGSSTADIYSNAASQGWTSSGGKKADFTIMYEGY